MATTPVYVQTKPLYLIAYDLDEPKPKHYKEVHEALKGWGGKRVLESTWVLRSAKSAEEISGALWKIMESSDRLVVVKVDAFANQRPMARMSEM